MGKRQNALAAQLRILKKSLFAHVVPGPSLQDVSVELHRFHCELVGRNHHFASQALEECRHLVPAPHRLWARNIHRAAALERHEVFPAAAQAWPALPAGIECSALEAQIAVAVEAKLGAPLSGALLANPPLTSFSWNVQARPFVPFCGSSRTLADAEQFSAPFGFDPIIGAWDALHTQIDAASLVFKLGGACISDRFSGTLSGLHPEPRFPDPQSYGVVPRD